MKSIITFFLAMVICAGQADAQQQPPQLLIGPGFRGITGDQDTPFGYSFTFGMIAQRGGFLSTLSYAENQSLPPIRISGLSTQFLLRVTDDVLLSAGPEIHITLLGLMKLGYIAECHYFLFDDVLISVGYSDVGKLNAGLLFAL